MSEKEKEQAAAAAEKEKEAAAAAAAEKEKAEAEAKAKAEAKAATATKAEKVVGAAGIPERLLKLVERPKTDERGKVVVETKKAKTKGGTVEIEIEVMRPIEADEVLAWRERGDQVVVVTVDGQKFVGEK